MSNYQNGDGGYAPDDIKEQSFYSKDADPNSIHYSALYRKGYKDGLEAGILQSNGFSEHAFNKGCEVMFEAMSFLVNTSVNEIEKVFGPFIFDGDPVKTLKKMGWEKTLEKINHYKKETEENASKDVMVTPGDVLECINRGSKLFGTRILVLRSLPGKIVGYSPSIESTSITIKGNAIEHWKFMAHYDDLSKIYADMEDPTSYE